MLTVPSAGEEVFPPLFVSSLGAPPDGIAPNSEELAEKVMQFPQILLRILCRK